MRALAILLVMAAHSVLPRWNEGWLHLVKDGMAVGGVELFFTLSGFLIGGILLRELADRPDSGWKDVRRFWQRRWFRTLPNYYLFLGLHAVLALSRKDTSMTAGAVGVHAVFLQNIFTQPPLFFYISWTLAIEEWSYILLPLLWMGLRRVGGRGPAAAASAVGLMVLAGLTLRLCLPWGDAALNTVIRRPDALMLGVAAAIVARYRPAWWQRARAFAPVGALLMFAWVSAYVITQNEPGVPPLWARVIVVNGMALGASLMLPWFSDWPAATFPGARVISWISAISYSLYLAHIPLIFIWHRVWFKDFGRPYDTLNEGIYLLICWISFFVVAGLVYRFFEQPVMRLRDRK